MKRKIVLKVQHLKKIQRLRDKVAEDVVREHAHEFFVSGKPNYTLKKGNREIEVSLRVIAPINDLMSLFRETKIKGYPKQYRKGILEVIRVISEMSVTPDVALMVASYVFKYRGKLRVLLPDECKSDIALVEIKRGKAGLTFYQKKDVEKAEKAGIPYYMVKVDDSEFVRGRFSLELELLTSNSLSIPA